jgi:hypothetical protein
MKFCHKCKKEITDDFFVGRQAQCLSCEVDLLFGVVLNAVGDNVASILVARILGGKNWMKENPSCFNSSLKKQ